MTANRQGEKPLARAHQMGTTLKDKTYNLQQMNKP